MLSCACSSLSSNYKVGNVIDSLNGVYVYYNGSFSNVDGRNKTDDGYNIGLKFQCVEFVKRYYLEFYNHKMPNSWGHAKDFFNGKVRDGKINDERNLYQYRNPSSSKPKVGDLIIFDGTMFNKFGHVAIISKVEDDFIEVIQQNVLTNTRQKYDLLRNADKWKINDDNILGWLRK